MEIFVHNSSFALSSFANFLPANWSVSAFPGIAEAFLKQLKTRSFTQQYESLQNLKGNSSVS